MKSPAEIAARLARQWQQADLRETRLLESEAWPLQETIGRPAARQLSQDPETVRAHRQRWKAVSVGEVRWEQVFYRSLSEPVELPAHWLLHRPSDWVAATGDAGIEQEYRRLNTLVAATDAPSHRCLIRQRHLWRDRTDSAVIQAAQLAKTLAQGCAAGRPLRALSLGGHDSKFFEHHRSLLLALLDVRHEGLPGEIGLEAFLGAADESEHWLLLAPLTPGLLPFARQRVRARELMNARLPGSHVLIVENERCLYQLPELPDTLAILGAGLNLEWLGGESLRRKRVAYWGDMDTWGLGMLAQARRLLPGLEALLMDQHLFDTCAPGLAVAEPAPAQEQPPAGLLPEEVCFYRRLRAAPRGRIEQEFLDPERVRAALWAWRNPTAAASVAPAGNAV